MIYYTDGSAHPRNPGPGGFGVVKVYDNGNYETYSKQTNEITTNNRMEMSAILWAICDAIKNNEEAEIYSDSSYAINTFSNWIYSWRDAGWTKSDGAIPENMDLLKAYLELENKTKITFHKVKGHNKILYNEIADKLAKGENIQI